MDTKRKSAIPGIVCGGTSGNIYCVLTVAKSDSDPPNIRAAQKPIQASGSQLSEAARKPTTAEASAAEADEWLASAGFRLASAGFRCGSQRKLRDSFTVIGTYISKCTALRITSFIRKHVNP